MVLWKHEHFTDSKWNKITTVNLEDNLTKLHKTSSNIYYFIQLVFCICLYILENIELCMEKEIQWWLLEHYAVLQSGKGISTIIYS